MVTIPKEKSFPRGGREQLAGTKRKGPKGRGPPRRREPSLFGRSPQTRFKNKKVDNEGKTSTPFYRIKPFTGQLKYSTITEEMLVLGCIFKIGEHHLDVSLPGNCTGVVPITNISEPYTKTLKSVMENETVVTGFIPFPNLFRVGQHVVAKVVKKQVVESSNRHKIILSLSPNTIHSECSSEDVLKGSVFTAAVGSIEEKGYIMDLGISSIRAFLKKENAESFEQIWNDGRQLGIGQLVQCLITNVMSGDKVTTVALTSDPSLVAKASGNSEGTRLQAMLPGMLFHVTVSRHIFPSGIQVRLSDNVVGYVHQNHFAKPFKTLENIEIGTVSKARVLYITESGTIVFTMRTGICGARPSPSPFNNLKAGTIVEKAVVMSLSDNGVTVRLGKTDVGALKGFIPFTHTNPKDRPQDKDFELTEAEQQSTDFPLGSKLSCRILDFNYMDQYYFCTMDKELMKEKYVHSSSLEVGLVLSCILKTISSQGIVVTMGKKSPVSGFVAIDHASDVPLQHPEKKFKVGQTCQARVLSINGSNIQLTMKPSLINSTAPLLTRFEDAQFGIKYAGTIKYFNEKGLMVKFYGDTSGWVPSQVLSSNRLQLSEIEKNFYRGQTINCYVIEKEANNQKLILSLLEKPCWTVKSPTNCIEGAQDSCISPDSDNTKEKKKKRRRVSVSEDVCQDTNDEMELQPKVGFVENLDNGTKSKKRRKLIVDSPSVPLKTKNSKKKKKENKSSADSSSFDVLNPEFNDETGVVENSVSNGTKTMGTAQKRKERKRRAGAKVNSDVEDIGMGSDGVRKTKKKTKSKAKVVKKQTTAPIEKAVQIDSKSKTNKKSRGKVEDAEQAELIACRPKKPLELPPLSAKAGFVWDPTPDLLPVVAAGDVDQESSDEEPEGKKKVKRSRQAIIAERRVQAQLEEARLRAVEARLMDPEQLPQTADEFDRLVLSSPDSSMVWLQYMAHHLQATEIEKARAVAQRALKTISFREEQEKLNVWVAWLNLENLYGTKESLDTTLQEALALNDPYQVYTQMLQIYGDSHKLQDCEALIAVMTKKFKVIKDMWLNVGTFYMKNNRLEKARNLLQRALTCLEKKEHVSVISQFALLENKFGSQERAQTLMEQILTSYPKRVDVWSAYVDMLVKSNLIAMARQVLERAVAQKLPSHKMKSLFKKFLSFEEAHGTEEGTNNVRRLALEYVEAAAGTRLD